MQRLKCSTINVLHKLVNNLHYSHLFSLLSLLLQIPLALLRAAAQTVYSHGSAF